ncbi:MAG: ANTAR domain-containing protein [Acholeplasmatales bacterium]|nr:ANTAR domain-containing protein [Acholeplasmatales bacterium]
MKENVNSLLIVARKNSFSDTIINLLKDKNDPIKLVESISEARRELIDNDYDLMIISSPLPDEFGINFAIDAGYKYKMGIILFVKNELYDEVYDKTYDYGILTVSRPTSANIIIQSVKLLESSIIRERKLVEKPMGIKDKLEEIRLINNAKLLLIKHLHMSEDEAHKHIEKRAMFIRKTKIYVAKEIISKYKEAK